MDDDGNKISSITDDFIEPRTNYDNLVQIMGSADVKYEVRVPLPNNPNTYRMVLEYFYTGLEDLSVTVTFTDDSGQIGEGNVLLTYHVILNKDNATFFLRLWNWYSSAHFFKHSATKITTLLSLVSVCIFLESINQLPIPQKRDVGT